MSKKIETFKFILSDLISSIIAWSLFFYFRKKLEGASFDINEKSFLIGIIFIVFIWTIIYVLSGRYKNVFRASRLQVFYSTFFKLSLDVFLYSLHLLLMT